MELGREMFECPLFPLGPILAPLTQEGWVWIEAEGGVASMAEEHAQEPEAEGSSYLILPLEGDRAPVAVGEAPPRMTNLSLVEQMKELEDLLREFGQRIGYHLPETRTSINAQKAMYRCVDTLRYFNDNN